MNEVARGLLADGALTVLEAAPGHLFAMGWFRLDEKAARADAGAGLPELLLSQPGRPLVTRPLRRLSTPPGQPLLRHFHVLLRVEEDCPAVTAALRLADEVQPLTPAPRAPTPFHRRGALEPLGRAGMAGWVFDLPGEVPELRLDGRLVLPLILDRDRPDLPFDDVEPGRRLGFNLTLEALGDALRGQDARFALMDGETHDVALLLGGQEHARASIRHARSLGGRLERAVAPLAEGWATESDPGPGPVTVDVLLEGTRWRSVRADLPRQDLLAQGVGSRLRGGAMRIALPWRNPSETPAPRLSLRAAHGAEELPGAVQVEGLEPWRPDRGAVRDALPAAWPAVTIIIPIYNAAEDLARCIEAVLRHTTGAARLLLIDDASPDPEVAKVLARHAGQPGVEVRRNAENRGFTATCNLGLEAAGRDDVVLLNSDTLVGPGWLDGLRLAALGAARVGTVTPLSNNAGAFSVPEINADNRLVPWFTAEDMARLARQAALALWPEVPTGHGFCMYIRRACLDAVGTLDEAAFPRGYGEENDFCLRAARAGFSNILDDRTLVWHRRAASFGEARPALMVQGRAVLEQRYPEYSRLTPVFAEDAAMLAVRWRVRRAVEAALAAGGTPRPRVLFVISTQSGGTPHTNRDLMDALSDRYEPWLLRCEAGLLELSRPGQEGPVEAVRLDTPLAPATHHSAAYDRAVADMLVRHGIELVHIRHIAWHGIGLPALCRQLGIPVVFSFHDFYTACPTVKLLDAQGRFCGGRCTEGEGDCAAELWQPSQMPPLRHRFVHRWRAMMAGMLEACDAFVTTAPSARDTLLDAFPLLRERGLRVIPHGRDFRRMERLAEEPALDEPLRVLVPGNVSWAKGSALIAAMAALDLGREVEFHMLGEVDQHLRAPRPGVILHGRYDREEFAARVRSIRPHMAAVLSIWPETWCHTLTECWAAGLPVLTFDLGAQGERVAASGAGWVLPADSPAEAVLAWLADVRRAPEAFGERERQVVRWQRELGRHHDTAAMAVAYDLLYRDVLRARRSFPGPLGQEAPCPVMLELQGRAGSASALPDSRAGLDLVRLPVAASFPFARAMQRDAGATGAPFGFRPQALAVSSRAVALHDLAGVIQDGLGAGLSVLVDVDEAMAAGLALPEHTEARAMLASPGVTVLARRPVVQEALASVGIAAAQAPLPGEPWALRAPPPEPARNPGLHRVLLLDGASQPVSPLRPVLEELVALEQVELLPGDRPDIPGTRLRPAAAFRALAESSHLGVLLGPVSAPRQDPLLRAAAHARLPVLVAADQWPPGEPAMPGVVTIPVDADGAVRTIMELLADAPRRRQLRSACHQAGGSPIAQEASLRKWNELLHKAVMATSAGALTPMD